MKNNLFDISVNVFRNKRSYIIVTKARDCASVYVFSQYFYGFMKMIM